MGLQAFAARYSLVGRDICEVGLLLKHAVEDLRQFVVAFKDYMCTVLVDSLNTRSRKLHAHAVLLDVVFPMVYEDLWSLYIIVSVV